MKRENIVKAENRVNILNWLDQLGVNTAQENFVIDVKKAEFLTRLQFYYKDFNNTQRSKLSRIFQEIYKEVEQEIEAL